MSASILALVLGAGRLILSFFPAGRIGGHEPRNLLVTCVTCFLLSCTVLIAVARPLEPFMSPAAQQLLLILVAAFALAARLMTLPGAMVPRHEPRPEPTGRATVVMSSILVAIVLTLGADAMRMIELPHAIIEVERGDGEFPPQTYAFTAYMWLIVATVISIDALSTAGRNRIGALVVASLPLLSLTSTASLHHPLGFPPPQIAGCAFGCGAAFAVGWLRRADRRNRALSITSFILLPMVSLDYAGLAFCGLFALILFTPQPSRAITARNAAVALVLALTSALIAQNGRMPDLIPLDQLAQNSRELAHTLVSFDGWPLLAILFAAAVVTFQVRMRKITPGFAEPPRREAMAVLFCVISAFIERSLWVVRGQWSAEGIVVPHELVVLPVVVTAALFVGLALVPPVRRAV